jgi:hypothetical protein
LAHDTTNAVTTATTTITPSQGLTLLYFIFRIIYIVGKNSKKFAKKGV